MNIKRFWMVLVLGFTVVLAGCQSTSSLTGSGDKTDPRLQNSADYQFFSKSGWQACAGGAAVGALACAISNSSNKAVCMAAAAVAGCGVGMGANAYLDNQRSKYANKEQRLNASIADVQADNQKLQRATTVAKSVIADDRQMLTQLQKDIAAKKVDQATVTKKLGGVDANIASLRKKLADMNSREKQWKDVSTFEQKDGNNTAQLDTDIGQMRTQVASLQSELDSLYTQRTALKVS